MESMRGVPAAPGIAYGRWTRIEPLAVAAGGRIGAGEVAAEHARLRAAVAAAGRELDEIAAGIAADGHPDEAAIFGAHAAIARDPALLTLAAARIDGLDDAVGAVQAAGAGIAEQLRALDDELLAARAIDVLDVVDRIVGRLTGRRVDPESILPIPAIIVALDLPPSVTATLPRDRLLGIALEQSSPTAHAAILARAYGIPAVVGVAGLLDALGSAATGRGTELAIDGETGSVVIDPDAATVAELDLRADAQRRRRAADVTEAGLPCATLDGTAVSLLANIGSPAESAAAIELGAGGVGLFRTEFLFLERAAPPSEDEQVAAYRAVVEAFRPGPVTIRLLDVGGDKPIPYLPIAPEDNPFLGVRAMRLARTDPAVFVTQLRACLRAATAGTIKVMAPMVADATDVELLHELVERSRRELADEGIATGPIEIGVMLEIPSAVLVADSYFGWIGFASLGTNDLLQYTVAVDRGNAALEAYRDSLHPAVLRLIRESVEAAGRAGIDLSVCGEMAGDPVAALALVGLGVRSLSMSAGSLAAVRRAIRAADLADLQRTSREALDDPSAAVVRERFAAAVAGSVAG